MVLGWPRDAVAETSVAESDGSVERLVVTARKREERLEDIPVAVTVLREGDIAARGITELNQVEKFAPNIVQLHFGQGAMTHGGVFIRGVGLQDHIITTDPAVGIYLDGVYLGRNVGANLDLADIERVEVARGPQGSLAGRNTLGGAIHVVTRKPAGANALRASVRAGSLGRLDGNAHADIDLGATAALSVSASMRSRDGVGRALRIDDPKAEFGEVAVAVGRASLVWQPSGTVAIRATVDHSYGRQGIGPYEAFVFNPGNAFGLRQQDQPRNPDDSHSLNNDLTESSGRSSGAALTMQWDLSEKLAFTAIHSAREMWFEAGLDNEKVEASLIEFPERGESDQTTTELRLAYVGGGMDWLAGLYAFDEDGFNDSPFVFRTPPPAGEPATIPTSDFPGLLYVEQETSSRAAFAHGSFDLSERWTLGTGARYTQDRKDAIGSLHYFPAPAHRSDDWSAWSADASLTWQAHPAFNAYARYARGYQAGGYPPRPFGGPDTFVAFDPTYADSFEVGVKTTPLAALRLNAALFRVQYTDLPVQVSELVAEGFLTRTRNAAESAATGVEVELSWQAGDFGLDAAVGLMDMEISAVDQRVQGIRPGDSPALTPDLTVSLSPHHRWQTPQGGTITARIDAYHRGAMYGQPINNRFNHMPALTFANASLAYDSADGRWQAVLYGNNLGNEIYPLARLDVDPIVLTIRSNDRREFGLRFTYTLGG